MSEHDEYYPWFMKMNNPISKEKTNTSLVTNIVKKKLLNTYDKQNNENKINKK